MPNQAKPIPFLDLAAHLAPLADAIQSAIEAVISSQRFIMGPTVQQFEAELAEYCRSAFAYGVSSGTDALLAALMALDVRPNDEIITSPYSFFATAGAIARMKAVPIFVDIDPGTYNLSPSLVSSALSPRTRGIIPVHLFGQMADTEALLGLARDHGLWVVEDAAQAIGSEFNGKRSGSMGDIGCLSFFPSKNLGCLGDGGAVITQNGDLALRLDLLRNHGAHPKYHHSIIGGNFRLDAIQAAVLSVELPCLDSWTSKRQSNAARYHRLFTDAGLVTAAEEAAAVGLIDGPVVLPREATGCRHVYNQYVLRVRDRDQLLEHMRREGVGCEIYYPIPLHLQPCFEDLGYKCGDLPEAELAAQETIAIPIYPELTDEQAEHVVAVIADFYSVGSR